MYNVTAFPVCGVFVSRLLLAAGFGTQRATSWAFAEQDAVANRGTEASSALERSSCSLVKGDEERLKRLKMTLHGWEYGRSTYELRFPEQSPGRKVQSLSSPPPIPLFSR